MLYLSYIDMGYICNPIRGYILGGTPTHHPQAAVHTRRAEGESEIAQSLIVVLNLSVARNLLRFMAVFQHVR